MLALNYNRGVDYDEQGYDESAIANYTKAIRLHPSALRQQVQKLTQLLQKSQSKEQENRQLKQELQQLRQKNEELTQELLQQRAKDEDEDVRRGVAANPNTPVESLRSNPIHRRRNHAWLIIINLYRR